MKLLSLLPKSLAHFACNSPGKTELGIGGNRGQSAVFVFFSRKDAMAQGFFWGIPYPRQSHVVPLSVVHHLNYGLRDYCVKNS